MKCYRRKSLFDSVNVCVRGRISSVLRVLVILLLLVSIGTCDRRKGFRQHLEKLFCSVDQDGDGEIEQHEATEFLSSIGAELDLAEESPADSTGGKDVAHGFISPHLFKGDFSYGGATISVEEMLNHLQNMLTADHVVDWITHGLQLPQYAQAFRENAVNGLDFPALIEDQSQTLLYELQIQSLLHRKKITHAIVRQVFGFGAVPNPPENTRCASARCGLIQLQWDSPSFLGYPPLHKYLIQKRVDNASSWMPAGDIKENSFLDNDGLHPRKFYAYRIQAWGNHGPSEWVQIIDCHNSVAFASDEHCDLEPGIHTAGAEPFVQVDAPSEGRRISTSDSHVSNAVNQRSAGWWWMYSVNGFLLILGIISRQSLFFRIILATWNLFRKKVLGTIYVRLVQAQNSQYLFERKMGQSLLYVFSFWLSMQAKIWDLSRHVNSAYPRRELAENDVYIDASEFSGTDPSFEDPSGSDALGSEVLSGKQGNASKSERMQHAETLQINTNKNVDGPMNSVLLDGERREAGDTETLVETTSDLRSECVSQGTGTIRIEPRQTIDDRKYFTLGDFRSYDFKMSSRSAPVERVNKCSESAREAVHASDCKKGDSCTMHGRNRFRCNFDRCKARFDRWHSLSDWHMKFTRHYCRECQGVYCINHTRISPHGPLGRCGLESNCVCQTCFEGLPSETQQKLEQRNKLRVGPYVSGDSLFREKKKRTIPTTENTSTDAKINKFDLSRNTDLLETENEPLSSRNSRNDPFPPDLGLANCSDSHDVSLTD